MATESDYTLDDLETELIDDAVEGVEQMQHGDKSLRKMSLRDRLDVLKELEDRGSTASAQPHYGLRFTQLKPPGCG